MNNDIRNDFPIDWEDDNHVTRREFLRFGTLASGGLAIGSLALAGWSRVRTEGPAMEPRRIAMASDLGPGEAIPFSYPRSSDICLLVRRPDGQFTAFKRRCTHLSCPVGYEKANDRLYCPCHNGAFSAEDGSVLQGPPPHPLPQIKLEVRGDEIWAVGLLPHRGHS
ncbi:MAG: ubiquinol-cytochrome c reductase iron-sulfur subunit [Fimbriimonadaceae bacterium]